MYSLVECNSDNLNAKLWPGWSLWILRMGARCIHQVGKRPACLSLSPQPSPDDSHRFLTFFSDTSSSQRIPGIKYNLESMVITLPKYIYLLCLRDFYFLRISKMLNPHFCPVTKNRPVPNTGIQVFLRVHSPQAPPATHNCSRLVKYLQLLIRWVWHRNVMLDRDELHSE